MVKIIPDDNNGCKIFSGNKVIGYVENQTLFGFGNDGYAVEICRIDNQSEIVGKLNEWRQKQT